MTPEQTQSMAYADVELVRLLREEARLFQRKLSAHSDRLNAACDLIESQAKHVDALKTVMIAAAEEIQLYWDSHCDADGYGPANLMRRLECGIPSEYGYTAGAFAALQQQLGECTGALDSAEREVEWRMSWQPIETAPRAGRELILILTPSRFPQVAYSNTWWNGGFSVENKPTHWAPIPNIAAMQKDKT